MKERAIGRGGRLAGKVALVTDEVTYMTGTELNIDGGILAGSTAQPVVGDGGST